MAIFVTIEDQLELRMAARCVELIQNEILFGDVGHVGRIFGLREEMVIRLILRRPNLDGNRMPPFIGVVEERIDIENDASKGSESMCNDVSDPKFGVSHESHLRENSRIR
jgi:hypothetical protein